MDSVFVMSDSGQYGKSDSLCFFPGSAMYEDSLFIMCLVYGLIWTNVIKSFGFINLLFVFSFSCFVFVWRGCVLSLNLQWFSFRMFFFAC